MKIKIEPVQTDEIALLVEISRSTFYDTFSRQNSKEDMELFLESSFTLSTLEREISEPANHFFFAKDNTEVAGYLKLSTAGYKGLAGEVVEIARIYVIKEKIGSGVGRALMEFSLSYTKENNIKTVFLGVWEHNKKAIKFYKQFGFEKFGEQIFMVGNDKQTDWLMKRELY